MFAVEQIYYDDLIFLFPIIQIDHDMCAYQLTAILLYSITLECWTVNMLMLKC